MTKETNGWNCQVCDVINGEFRKHCYYCGASRNRIYWNYGKVNSWHKTRIDYDRPIHRANTSLRDIKVQDHYTRRATAAPSHHRSQMIGERICVVTDPILRAAQELAK